jgi:hypothetical protein
MEKPELKVVYYGQVKLILSNQSITINEKTIPKIYGGYSLKDINRLIHNRKDKTTREIKKIYFF